MLYIMTSYINTYMRGKAGMHCAACIGRPVFVAPDAAVWPRESARSCKAEQALWAQAFLIEHDSDTVDFVGNRTDCALLMLLRAWGVRYEALREVRLRMIPSYQESLPPTLK